MSSRLSGLQKQVVSLYRRLLRAALKKDKAFMSSDDGFKLLQNPSASSTNRVSQEFRRQALIVKRSDFKRIEYLIRKGEKQLKLIQMPGVKTVGGG